MRPVPPWRFAPFRDPAASDVNLCTDSVLPGSIAPGPVTLRAGFVATSLQHSMNINVWNTGWGRSLPYLQRNSSILTGLTCLPALPSYRGLHLVYAAWESPRQKPRRSPPKTHSIHLFPAALMGFLQYNCAPR